MAFNPVFQVGCNTCASKRTFIHNDMPPREKYDLIYLTGGRYELAIAQTNDAAGNIWSVFDGVGSSSSPKKDQRTAWNSCADASMPHSKIVKITRVIFIAGYRILFQLLFFCKNSLSKAVVLQTLILTQHVLCIWRYCCRYGRKMRSGEFNYLLGDEK